MNLNSFIIFGSISCLVGTQGTKEGCVSLDEKNVSNLERISSRLDQFLKQNLDEGHLKLKKVLETYGGSKVAILKVDPADPLESYLLQHQIVMHNTIKEMMFIMKSFMDTFGGAKGSLRSSRNLVFNSEEKDNSKLSLKRHQDSFISSSYTPTDSTFRPSDCSQVLVAGFTESGIYKIYPFKCICTRPVEVYCDMDTDGGGWTVFMSRLNVSKPINFTRNWDDYRDGFGTPGQEHWLGNEFLHTLTYNQNYILRLEASDGFGRHIWGEWNNFKIQNEDLKYKIVVSLPNVRNTAFDRFAYVNNNYFSSFDRDSDKHGTINCADKHRGGWWYNACLHNNPNGVHDRGDDKGLQFKPWSKTDKITRYAKSIKLKIRPVMCNNKVYVAKMNTHNCVFK